MTEHGRIKPRRQTGLDAKSQRYIAREIKRARHLAAAVCKRLRDIGRFARDCRH